MNKCLPTWLRWVYWPGWLTGPIFDKELRVSSRRRRNYVLRCLYILVLTFFVAIVWLGVVQYQSNSTFQQSRMAVAGKRIVSTVAIFQFVAMQLLAIIMLSNAISDELYHRTLGLLMTTPINSLQIVMGKVLSRLLQLLQLLAITLPILAIVRLLGGVSWDFLLSSLCITLTAALFAGSLSLFLSIRNRLSYGVVLRTVGLLCCLYFLLPATLVAMGEFVLPRFGFHPDRHPRLLFALSGLFAKSNPVYGMGEMTRQMMTPAGRVFPYYWPVQCGVMLGLSAVVLAWAVAVVRKVALRQATGQLTEREMTGTTRKAGKRASRKRFSPIRRVRGPAIVWRELRAPFIQGIDNRNSYIGLAMTIGALLVTYLATASQDCLDEDFVHVSYVMLFLFLGGVVNVIFAATRITTEKESQSWLLLLATPLSDWDILFGKAVSAFRRCLPIWGLLAGHMVVFVAIRYIHPAAMLHLFVLVAWLTFFITGTGLYFSARFTRTTSAVMASFAVMFGLWAVGPIIVGLVSEIVRHDDVLKVLMWCHPAVQAGVIMTDAAGVQNAQIPWRSLNYQTEFTLFGSRRTIGVLGMTGVMAAVGGIYSVIGWFFLWRAKCRLRKRAV